MAIDAASCQGLIEHDNTESLLPDGAQHRFQEMRGLRVQAEVIDLQALSGGQKVLPLQPESRSPGADRQQLMHRHEPQREPSLLGGPHRRPW